MQHLHPDPANAQLHQTWIDVREGYFCRFKAQTPLASWK
jgi:hypothetical protein